MDSETIRYHSRGYLPHIDGAPLVQFVTYRLHGSVPRSLLAEWQIEGRTLPQDAAQRRERQRIEAYLDTHTDVAWLADPAIASLVQDNLLHFHRSRYQLYAWIIMPTHVHLLLTVMPGYTLSHIMQAAKSYTTHAANRHLCRTGPFWHADYFDRFMRSARQLTATFTYIEANPVKAGLCTAPDQWPYSSASWRSQQSDFALL